MTKTRSLLLGITAIFSLIFISSCKDKEEPLPVAGIQFETDEQEMTESDGTVESFDGRIVEAKLTFDKALADNVVLEFDVDGTAGDSDFELVEEGENVTIDDDQITITKGATEASFSVRVFEDQSFEVDFANEIAHETIQLTLESVVSGPATIGTDDEHTIFIFEDDAIISMAWNQEDGDNDDDVDMDIVISLDGGEPQVFDSSTPTEQYEGFFIPAGLGDASLDMSYRYSSGTSDQVDFDVEILNFGGMVTKASGGSAVSAAFSAVYTAANLYNASTPRVAQTMEKEGLDYINVSEITVHETSSRQRTSSHRNASIYKRFSAAELKPLKVQ